MWQTLSRLRKQQTTMNTATKISFSILGILGLGAAVWAIKRRANRKYIEQWDALKLRTIADKILVEASKYIGTLEITPNAGWKNADDFTKKMQAAGWYKGAAYCAAFVRMVLLQVSSGASKDYFSKNLSLNTGITWSNISKGSQFCKVVDKPERGCLVCYNGHIEICYEVLSGGYINCVSANSMSKDSAGNDIEGVFLKKRVAGSALGTEAFLGYVKILKLD